MGFLASRPAAKGYGVCDDKKTMRYQDGAQNQSVFSEKGGAILERLPPPPRSLPARVFCKCLFSGAGCQLSWLFLGLGTAFFFAMVFDLTSVYLSLGEVGSTRAEILDQRETFFSTAMIGPNGLLHRTGEDVHRYSYRFEAGGRAYTGHSYGTRKQVPERGTVDVEYLKTDPSVSRIERLSPELHLGGGFAPVVASLAAIVVAFFAVLTMTIKRLRLCRLLVSGEAVSAMVSSKNLLSRNSGREWYEVVYEYDTPSGTYKLHDRPHYTERIGKGDRRTVLYDRRDPAMASVLENVPVEAFRLGSQVMATYGWPAVLVPAASTVLVLLSAYLQFF